MEIRKKRVIVRRGRWYGLKGWGYFTENQDDWDSVTVCLDKLPSLAEGPESGSALGAMRKSRALRVEREATFAPAIPIEEVLVRHNYMVRIMVGDLTVLSELEAIVDCVLDAEENELCPPRLK